MLKTTRYFWAAPLALALCAFGAGCGGGGTGPSTPGSGTLSVSLVDAPDPSISSLNVTIDRVEAHIVNPSDPNDNDPGHWRAITSTPRTFDLLDLQRNEAILGSATLPVGSYSQIRLFPSSATLTDSTGTHNVSIPSASQTGIKLNVNYTISANEVTAILLDFNVSKSLIKTGNGQYRLQPVIPVVVKALSGTITGTVSDGSGAVNGADIKAVYTAGDKYALGTEVNTSVSAADGSFKIWALLPGTYDLTVTTLSGSTVTRSGVTVSASRNTAVGTLTVASP